MRGRPGGFFFLLVGSGGGDIEGDGYWRRNIWAGTKVVSRAIGLPIGA